MNAQKWAELLPNDSHATVLYHDPDFGCAEPWYCEDFLLVAFPNDVRLEVLWDYDNEQYLVKVTSKRFASVIIERLFPDVEAVKNGVKRFATVASFASKNLAPIDIEVSATQTTPSITQQVSYPLNRGDCVLISCDSKEPEFAF